MTERLQADKGQGLALDLPFSALPYISQKAQDGVSEVSRMGGAAGQKRSGIPTRHAAASAQCGLQGDAGAVRSRADQVLVDMAEALLWPEG